MCWCGAIVVQQFSVLPPQFFDYRRVLRVSNRTISIFIFFYGQYQLISDSARLQQDRFLSNIFYAVLDSSEVYIFECLKFFYQYTLVNIMLLLLQLYHLYFPSCGGTLRGLYRKGSKQIELVVSVFFSASGNCYQSYCNRYCFLYQFHHLPRGCNFFSHEHAF